MPKVTSSTSFAERMLGSLHQAKNTTKSEKLVQPSENKKVGFIDYLKQGIEDTNQVQKIAENKAKDMVTGKDVNLHETMLASSYAELSFNLMVQVRNKALEAYQEVMRMPV